MKKVLAVFLFLLFLLPTPAVAFRRTPILMYHYIGNNPVPSDKARDWLSVSPDKFEQQMSYLKTNGYTPITLDTLYSGNYPPKSVVLTFDDGYEDFYSNAFPVLQKYGYHVVAFIPTGLMNQGYYLSWDQIRQMRGLVSFEAHGVTHRSFLYLSPAALKNELETSKSVLQSQTGQIINFVAYPNGAFNWNVSLAVSRAGYVAGLGTWERTRINNFTSISQFATLINKWSY